jgi:hypothetical protein
MTKIFKLDLKLIILTIAIFLLIFRILLLNNVEPIFGRFDSPSYFNFTFSGGVRMPLISFIFSRIQDYYKIMIFHAIISSISWTILSLVLFRFKFNKILIFLMAILVLSLGNSKPIIYLDSVIDSESLTISFLVILFASVLSFYARQSKLSILFILIACILFAGIKSINAIIILLPLCFVLYVIFRNKDYIHTPGRILIFLTTSISVLSIYLFLNIQATQILNTSGVINARLWKVESWKKDVLESGFPVEARSTYLRFTNRNLGLPPDTAVANLPKYLEWYENGGDKFLIKFMITNPGYTVFSSTLLPVFTRELNFEDTIWRAAADGILYYESRQHDLAVKSPENYLFWSQERSSGYLQVALFLILIVLGLGLRLKKYSSRYLLQNAIVLLLFVSFFNSFLSWWFGSTPSDVGRHQFPFSVSLRIIAILSLLLLMETFIKDATKANFLQHFLGFRKNNSKD